MNARKREWTLRHQRIENLCKYTICRGRANTNEHRERRRRRKIDGQKIERDGQKEGQNIDYMKYKQCFTVSAAAVVSSAADATTAFVTATAATAYAFFKCY